MIQLNFFILANFKKLKQRINIIPISLALGQAIIESGWGQSRFALEGNALYGQWTTNEQRGIIPEARDEDKNHAVLKFDSLQKSVQAYMHNINTHPAYYSFRVVRRIAERVQYTDPISAKVKFLAAYAGSFGFKRNGPRLRGISQSSRFPQGICPRQFHPQ